MRVCTYNIHAGLDANRQPSLPLIIEALGDLNSDVVFLQEVDRFLPRSGWAHEARRIACALNMNYAFYGRLRCGPAAFGNAVLYKGPRVPRYNKIALPSSGGEPRTAVGVHLPKPGQAPPKSRLVSWLGMFVFCTHLGLRDDWRESQPKALAKYVGNQETDWPVILGGDFNAPLNAPEIVQFLKDTNLDVLSGDQPTFPVPNPAHRIDFLFGRGFHRVNGGSIDAPGSDHCLVWADLERTAPLPAGETV